MTNNHSLPLVPRRRVGYILSPKKTVNIKFDKINRVSHGSKRNYNRERGFEFTIRGARPFVAILHKATHILLSANRGESKAKQYWQTIENLVRDYPTIVWIDPPSSLITILSRESTLNALIECQQQQQQQQSGSALDFKVPPYKVINPINCNNEHTLNDHLARLRFPVICKTVLASESPESHYMSLVWSPDDIQIGSTTSNTESSNQSTRLIIQEPMIIQEFIDHGGIIFKVYVADDWLNINARPSMMDASSYSASQNMLKFDSQELPKKFISPSDNTHLLLILLFILIWQQRLQSVDQERIRRIANVLSKLLSITLFGFDVIIASSNNDYYVVDVNYFPGK
ncbi:inositol-tetrakisphosphate 1-kinase [Syncephalis fuscata]|nr:inositol-tetrakisphosphate 1-kinase [Syncephalis fuscata]